MQANDITNNMLSLTELYGRQDLKARMLGVHQRVASLVALFHKGAPDQVPAYVTLAELNNVDESLPDDALEFLDMLNANLDTKNHVRILSFLNATCLKSLFYHGKETLRLLGGASSVVIIFLCGLKQSRRNFGLGADDVKILR